MSAARRLLGLNPRFWSIGATALSATNVSPIAITTVATPPSFDGGAAISRLSGRREYRYLAFSRPRISQINGINRCSPLPAQPPSRCQQHQLDLSSQPRRLASSTTADQSSSPSPASALESATERTSTFNVDTNPYKAKRQWPPDMSQLSEKQQFRLERKYRRRTQLKYARPTWKKWTTLVQWVTIGVVTVYSVFFLELDIDHKGQNPFQGLRDWAAKFFGGAFSQAPKPITTTPTIAATLPAETSSSRQDSAAEPVTQSSS